MSQRKVFKRIFLSIHISILCIFHTSTFSKNELYLQDKSTSASIHFQKETTNTITKERYHFKTDCVEDTNSKLSSSKSFSNNLYACFILKCLIPFMHI